MFPPSAGTCIILNIGCGPGLVVGGRMGVLGLVGVSITLLLAIVEAIDWLS